jgi:hypothetical protein
LAGVGLKRTAAPGTSASEGPMDDGKETVSGANGYVRAVLPLQLRVGEVKWTMRLDVTELSWETTRQREGNDGNQFESRAPEYHHK